MYYLIYGLLYLFSLLPFFIVYLLSDFVYMLLYYVFGYRKKIVMSNIGIAFPEKTIEERTRIAKQFYKNLVDTFIEMLKMASMTGKQLDKRCTIDVDAMNELAARGKSIQLHGGHQMNWEYANWAFARKLNIPLIAIYQPIANKPINKIFYNLRSRYNSKMVSTREFKTVMHSLFKSQYVIGLVADQNTNPTSGYWLYFFTKPVPFITGPEKGAVSNDTAVVFGNLVKKRRGHYHIETKVVTENAGMLPKGELTRKYRDYLEETIRRGPDNYLWSHRRWRHEYNNDLRDQWIDDRQP